MSKAIKPDALASAIEQELTIYSKEVTERVNTAARTSAEKLRKLTKASAPVDSGDFRKHIAVKEMDAGHGMKKFIWYVRDPDYRLTHLIVHGHATRTGGRTKANPFLKKALDVVLPEFEQDVKEACKG